MSDHAALDALTAAWRSGSPCPQHAFVWCADCNPNAKPVGRPARRPRKAKDVPEVPAERPVNRTARLEVQSPSRWVLVTDPAGRPIPQGHVESLIDFTATVLTHHAIGAAVLLRCDNVAYAQGCVRRLRADGLCGVIFATRSDAALAVDRLVRPVSAA